MASRHPRSRVVDVPARGWRSAGAVTVYGRPICYLSERCRQAATTSERSLLVVRVLLYNRNHIDDTAGLLRWEVWRALPSKMHLVLRLVRAALPPEPGAKRKETSRGPQAPAPPPGEFASSIIDEQSHFPRRGRQRCLAGLPQRRADIRPAADGRQRAAPEIPASGIVGQRDAGHA